LCLGVFFSTGDEDSTTALSMQIHTKRKTYTDKFYAKKLF
jgi:hypothetical protein